tara:strand:- start:154 stop:1149 length:996 start_codon:yes stop_codon:yes gene_type:complete
MAFRKLVGSYKDYELSTHIIEDGYLAVDVDTGSLRIGDGTTPGGTEVGGGGSSSSLGDLSAVGSTLSAPTNADMTLQTSGTGSVIINDTFQIGSGAGVTTILDEDNFSSNSDTALATQQSIKAYVDNEVSNVSVGDLSFVGSTIAAPSNADLTLTSSNGNVVIEGIRIAGTTLSTEDSSPGLEISGNLIPSQNGVFQLGSSTRRWQTAFLSAETLDIGGATISSDGTGTLAIAATGATLPVGSKVGTNGISLTGAKAGTLARPVQNVKLFVSDGSTSLTDTQLLALDGDLTLEFNATVEDVPVYTDAGQTFTLNDGTALADNAAGITLFQF